MRFINTGYDYNVMDNDVGQSQKYFFILIKELALKNKPFDEGLDFLRDQRWKSVRNVLTPTFSALQMKKVRVNYNVLVYLILNEFPKMSPNLRCSNCKEVSETLRNTQLTS